MNKVILIGNLASKPEAFTTQSGIVRSTFKIAVQRRFTNAQGVREADFLPVIAWRQTAEFCNKYLDKGRKVAVEGSIQTRSYDAQDGSKRYVTEVVVENVEFVASRQDGGGSASPPPAPQGTAGGAQAPQQQRMDLSGQGSDGFTEVEDEDELPFE